MLDTMRPNDLFPMPPEVTQVILGGGSSIDLDSLRIHSPGEAWNFALNYGYDMSIPVQRAAVLRVYEDAVDFLEGVVLDGTDLHVPFEVRDLQDLHADCVAVAQGTKGRVHCVRWFPWRVAYIGRFR